MRPEVSGDHSEVHGVQGGTPESPRSLLQTAIGDLGDKSAVEKLDEQHAANTKAIEELDTLLNKHLKEHPEISSSQKPLDDLKKDHETLAEMLGDDEMRAELLSDHDSRMAFQTDVDSISDRAGELKGAIEQKLPASTERLPDQHDDATASAASDDSLARQAERSGFGDIDARRLERISKALDLTENAGPQTKDIHNALSEIKAELSTAFADRRAGHGIEPASLSEHIQKITMYSDRLLSSEQTLQSLPQEELKQKAERLRGLSAELHCANDVARSGEAASFIVLGVEGYKGDGTRMLEMLDSKERSVIVDLSPINEADVLYQGKDGKTHIVEVKRSPDALLQTKSEQLKRLSDWQRVDKDNREAVIALYTSHNWPKLVLEASDTGKPVLDTLITRGIGLRIEGTDLNVTQLKELRLAVRAAWEGFQDRARAMENFVTRMSAADPLHVLNAYESVMKPGNS